MNNVGEVFFSSPIDPFDISKDWGRSDDDQRHRLVVNGAVNTPMAPAHDGLGAHQPRLPVERHAAGLSALPFNITSGVTTLQGTTSRPRQTGPFRELRRDGRSSSRGTPASAATSSP